VKRGNALVRQWILLRTLSARRDGIGVQALAQELQVNERTVRRDLEALQAAGFPLAETVEAFGRKKWRLDQARTQPALGFAFDEAVALYLGRRLLDPLAGTVFWEAAQRAFRKIRTMLSPGALKYLDRFAPLFHQTQVGASDYSKKGELIDQLVMAMEERRITHITYQSLQATEAVTYDVYPLGMVSHGQSLYLVGWAPRRERLQHWKVDRIEDVEVTPLQFQQPEGFDLRQHLAKSFGIFHDGGAVHVKIRFSPTVARYVQEGRWHETQRLTRQPDGSLLAEFDLCATEEIKHWLLSFGQHAVVIEPVSLAEEMRDEIEKMSRTYAAIEAAPNNAPAKPHRGDQRAKPTLLE
jgi:proteasome accessory factor B